MPIKRKPTPLAHPPQTKVSNSPTTFQEPSWSPEQLAVFNWVEHGSGNALAEAVAGAGKSTLLKGVAMRAKGTKVYCAYNRKIVDEVGDSMPGVTVSTFHSLGLAAWSRHCRATYRMSPKIDARKKRDTVLEKIDVDWNLRNAVWALVSIAKQDGVDILWDSRYESNIPHEKWRELVDHYSILEEVEEVAANTAEEVLIAKIIDYAIKCVAHSRKIGNLLIDFDDMIWMPLVENAHIPTYDWVLGDEFQDVNAVRREFARRMMKPTSRALFVADRFQNIYGFTGSGSDAVQRTITDFKCATYPLTTTFRCAQSATQLAQTFVPHIQAHPKNEKGTVTSIPESVFRDSLLDEDADFSPRAGDVILCRNTKPLVALAMYLIRNGVGCYVEGRDIGANIMALIRKWKKVDSVEELQERLRGYGKRQSEKLIAKNQLYKLEGLYDRVETAIILTKDCDTIQEVDAKVRKMFEDVDAAGARKVIMLSTVHKAKGREWSRVFILGWNRYMPSKWARQEWEKQSEVNLQYVSVTRCKKDLVLVVRTEEK